MFLFRYIIKCSILIIKKLISLIQIYLFPYIIRMN
jgi:hypothetical protein